MSFIMAVCGEKCFVGQKGCFRCSTANGHWDCNLCRLSVFPKSLLVVEDTEEKLAPQLVEHKYTEYI